MLAALLLLSCSAFPSGRTEKEPGKERLKIYWILEGPPGSESAEVFIERFYLPTSLAMLLWTGFTVQGEEVLLDTRGGYRVLNKKQFLVEPLGSYTVYGYELDYRVTSSPPPSSSRAESYTVRFSYRRAAARPKGVLPQPLEQALIAAVRKSGRSSGTARVVSLSYQGSGGFKAEVQVGG
jgi:hypothetical protein